MATYTENYNLKMPSGQDAPDVEDFNTNAEIIDTVLKAHSDNTADEYSPDETYTAGRLVINNNALWKAKQDISVPEPWTPDHWDPTTLAAELSAVNSRLPKGKERIVVQSITGAGTIPIPGYNSYKALVVAMYGDGNNGNPIFIPQQMYDVDIPFSISSDNEQGGTFTVYVQGKILNGNVDISYCKTTGWSNATLVVYGIS